MMAERGFSLAHTTIMRWIQRYVPEFEKRWNRFARQAGRSWRVDETYVKIKGRWTYLYRAVDKEGKTVDFLLRAKRDVAAAKAFFRRAFRGQGRLPHKITLDGYQASHRAAKEVLDEHPEGNQCEIRSSKYLNNLIEQDHRSIKLRLGPMLGFKRFRRAATTIAGIELMHRIRKGQFKLGSFASKTKPLPRFGMQFSPRDPASSSRAPAWLDFQSLHHSRSTRAQRRKTRRGSNRRWMNVQRQVSTLDRIHDALYVECRQRAEREASPTAAIIPTSQSVKSAEKGGLTTRMATMRARRSKARSGIFLSIRRAS